MGLFGILQICTLWAQEPPSGATEQNTPEPALTLRPATPADKPVHHPEKPELSELILVGGTPIRVAISDRVRISQEGAPIHGRVTDTVYAFDQAVIPAGCEVTGRVTGIDAVSRIHRVMAIADADFSPRHQYEITFDTLVLPDGRRFPLETTVGPGGERMVHLVSAPNSATRKGNLVTQAVSAAKQEVHNDIHRARWEIKSPGRMHRIKQLLLAQLLYRREYLEPGTRFNADLDVPVDFGSVSRTPLQLSALGTEPPTDVVIHARLAEKVSSATVHRGDPVHTVITQPVLNSEHQLVLPADSRIMGEVTQAKPARKLHHNGELRIMFKSIETNGTVRAMQDSLEGVETNKAADVKLDAEGGAHTSDSKSRYVATGLSIFVASAAAHPESDNGESDGIADPATRTAAGGFGFKLVGAVVSLVSRSKVFSSTMGVYGASMSVYSHFLSRGRDVVFAKDTPVEIGFHAARPAAVP